MIAVVTFRSSLYIFLESDKYFVSILILSATIFRLFDVAPWLNYPSSSLITEFAKNTFVIIITLSIIFKIRDDIISNLTLYYHFITNIASVSILVIKKTDFRRPLGQVLFIFILVHHSYRLF